MSTATRKEKLQTVMSHIFKRRKIAKYTGQKTRTLCPRCGAPNSYHFDGLYKCCFSCGLDNRMENVCTHIRYMVRHERARQPSDRVLDGAYDYVTDLEPVEEK